MSGGSEEAVIIADISGDGCAVLHSQGTKGRSRWRGHMSEALATHGDQLRTAWPNPACHLFLFYWITATPIHLLTV